MELCREYRPRLVNQALVARVVEVDEILLPVGRHRRHVHCVAMVLGRNMALARREIQRRDIVSPISERELYRLGSSSQPDNLVAHTYTHSDTLARLDTRSMLDKGPTRTG